MKCCKFKQKVFVRFCLNLETWNGVDLYIVDWTVYCCEHWKPSVSSWWNVIKRFKRTNFALNKPRPLVSIKYTHTHHLHKIHSLRYVNSTYCCTDNQRSNSNKALKSLRHCATLQRDLCLHTTKFQSLLSVI